MSDLMSSGEEGNFDSYFDSVKRIAKSEFYETTHDLSDLTYLDYQSTTPLDPRVLKTLIWCYGSAPGNPHARSHAFGWNSEDLVEKARGSVSKVIKAEAKDMVFTSGATEANNLAIKGAALFYGSPEKDHIVTLITEHKCVIEACRNLETQGFKVTYLPVKENGLVDLKTLEDAITPATIMVSVMGVNNEIGVIQPLKEIGEICQRKRVLFHSDCAQAYGKVPLDVDEMNIDLMSISAHKIYGPKGVGALYVRRKPRRIRLKALFSGGGQERGIRSGTVPTEQVVAFGAAAEIALADMEKDTDHVKMLYDTMRHELFESLEEIRVNGDEVNRYFGNINISFSYIEGESLMMAFKKIAVSSGSACTSSSLESSYVLKSLGLSEEASHSSIRFGFGRFTTLEEVKNTIEVVKASVLRLREMSPLWEMFKEGIDLDTVEWEAHH